MAASNAVDVGTGASISFLGDGAAEVFTATIQSFELGPVTRSVVETTHLGTTGGRTFIGGDLYDGGELTVDMQWPKNQTFIAQLNNAAATCTLTFPLQSGESTPTTLAGSAILTSFSGTIPLEAAMTARATLKFTGNLTLTAST